MTTEPSAQTLLETLTRVFQELDDTGHRYQIYASSLLRAGRRDWEPWFEAGVELRERARRLRGLLPPPARHPAQRPTALSPSRDVVRTRQQTYRTSFSR